MKTVGSIFIEDETCANSKKSLQQTYRSAKLCMTMSENPAFFERKKDQN